MIFINPDSIRIPEGRLAIMNAMTASLIEGDTVDRAEVIDAGREQTWSHADVLAALRAAVGNKCWYSEVHLEGADANVDHFRPKGRVREIDAELRSTGESCEGYWWLAFEPLNFRLASMHSNQRRTDEDTNGGKADFFPVRGDRAPPTTPVREIRETVLPIDPCSASDVRLLWFDPDGTPCAASWRHRAADDREAERVRVSIWLYHLDKKEIQSRRSRHVQDVLKDIRKANADYRLWAPDSPDHNLDAKAAFDEKVAEIKVKIADDAEFARAKRCAVRSAIADYAWIEEFNIV